jgi:hypothetical protein
VDQVARAAFVIAQAACAQVEALGMLSTNQTMVARGEHPRYVEQDFLDLQNKYVIGHNAVIDYLQ